MSPFTGIKNTLITVCAMHMYLAHVAFCVSVWHVNGLRVPIGKTFECRQHSAEDCLRLFVHGNVQLTWVSDTHAWTLPLVSDTHAWTLPLVSGTNLLYNSFPSLAPVSVLQKNRQNKVPNSATVHCGQCYDRKAGGPSVARWRKILQKKLKYILAKGNTACYGSINIFTSIIVSLWSRNVGKTWQQW